MVSLVIFWILVFILIKYLLSEKKEKDMFFVKSEKRKKKRSINEKKYNAFLSKKDKEEILVKYKNECFKCGSQKNLTLDHHMPLSLGYGLKKGNIVVLCKKCNNKKGHLLPSEYYTSKEIMKLKTLYNIDSHERIRRYNKREYKSLLNTIQDLKGEEVMFYYLGKVIRGQLVGIVEKKEIEMYKNRERFVEVFEEDSVNLYRLKGIKEIYINKRG